MSLNFDLNVDASKATASINQFFNAFEQGAAQATNKLAKSLGQPIQKEIQIKLEGGELVGRQVAKLGKDTQDIVAGTKALKGEYGKTANALKQQERAIKRVLGDTQKWVTGTRRLNPEYQKLQQALKDINREQQKLGGGNAFQGLFAKFVGVQTLANLATGAIQNVGRAIINTAQTGFEMETLSLQLEAFTGDAESAEAAFKEFANIAAKTPFDLKQVANAGRIMMAFGIEADAAIEATDRLAIVAAATGGDLQLLARNMGQIVAQGRAYTRDLTQFAIQGVPIWEQLSIVTGESVAALKNLAKEGKIGGAEVTEALRLMTQEGTAFFEIAQRMQETFQGRFAKIESAVQQLAKAFVDTFNDMDRALGLIVSKSMKAFADAIVAVAENLDTIAKVAVSATIALLAMFGAQLLNGASAASNVFKLLVFDIKLFAVSTWKAVAAKAALLGLSGPKGWAILAAGIGIATGAYFALSAAMDNSQQEMADLNREAAAAAGSVSKLSDAEEKYAKKDNKELVGKYREARKEADGIKSSLDAQVEALERMKDKIEERYNREIELSKDRQATIKGELAEERIEYDRIKEKIQQTYEPKIKAAEESLRLLREENSEAISALQARTPQEQKLLDFEKEKLKQKLASSNLSKEERLQIEARLSRMERTAQIEELRAKQKKEEKALEDKIAKLKSDQEAAEKRLEESQGARIKALEKGLADEQAKVRELEQDRKKATKPLDDAIKKSKDIGIETDISTTAVNNQITAVNKLAVSWRKAEAAAAAAAKQIRSAQSAQNGGGGGDNRFAGGSVTGGTTYTVNEFGKEAFLSNTGKLSMINAPAWGQWKAPGAGSVIPAHLTKQLDVPSGGTQVNKAAASQVNRAGASGGDMMRALRGLTGGSSDRITNNVTIQAANTTQAASDMMVQLNKIRRRRLG